MQSILTKPLITTTLLSGVVLWSACDSSVENPPTDEEMLVGTWAITGFFDDTGDRSDILATGFEGLHVEFADDGTGAFEIFPRQVPAKRVLANYTISDGIDLITMWVAIPIDALVSMELTYTFLSDAQRVRFHTTDADALNTLFESDLVGDVTVVASKFGEDGVVE